MAHITYLEHRRFMHDRLPISPMLFELLRGSGSHFQPKGLTETATSKANSKPTELPTIVRKRHSSAVSPVRTMKSNKHKPRRSAKKPRKVRRPLSSAPEVTDYYVYLEGYFRTRP